MSLATLINAFRKGHYNLRWTARLIKNERMAICTFLSIARSDPSSSYAGTPAIYLFITACVDAGLDFGAILSTLALHLFYAAQFC